MIKAINTDGQIVTLEKDCRCQSHEGPHWLDASKRWRQRNLNIDCSTSLGVMAKAQEEIRRLDEKLFHMQKNGIVQLLNGDDDDSSER